MIYKRPIVLSIAGFDPTGGAGVLADVKTFEQHRCLGMAAVTAQTVQTEERVISVDWLHVDAIVEQIRPLFDTYSIQAVKIGIVENLENLFQLLQWIRNENDSVRIVWDPVLSASSGLAFLTNWPKELLEKTLGLIDVITPNVNEMRLLSGEKDEEFGAKLLSKYTSVLLKGGHSTNKLGYDILYCKNGEMTSFPPKEVHISPKHGSGCMLSSAIAANLAHGNSLEESCKLGKEYVEKRLKSNDKLLAYHAE